MPTLATASKPLFCQYADGPCDQSLPTTISREAFFIYPSTPAVIAQTVKETVRSLQKHSSKDKWTAWEDLAISGQVIFCEICKAIRSSQAVVANITTLNFNVLFEVGFAIGLGKPILPIRDTSYEKDKKLFDEIGIFDVLGYIDFSNSVELAALLQSKRDQKAIVHAAPSRDRTRPIYYLRAPIETDGSIRILSELKKSSCPFRTFDSRETSRLSLHEAYKQVHSSTAVVAHLIDPNRTGASAHNARCAFVCGLALAAQKFVLMLQEGIYPQPIDYRDLIVPYEDVSVIPLAIQRLVRATAEYIYSTPISTKTTPQRLLERVDLGDVAAENEIQGLSSHYFVRTPQFLQAQQGHARLIIGRKGAGKTAMFYGLRKAVGYKKNGMVLDLKPEGHQFVKLRETVLARLGDGDQQSTLTAFWHYLLLLEVARKIIEREATTAWRDPESLDEFKELQTHYKTHAGDDESGDFSERLMELVNRLVKAVADAPTGGLTGTALTAAIYRGDISQLRTLVLRRQATNGDLWILFDNIDKGFPTHGLAKEDILIVRCLLEATRKLQRELQKNEVDCIGITFIRRDVYDLLVENTPDRGKESHVDLDWSDEELMKQLFLLRVNASIPELKGAFNDVWHVLFDAHVGGESSFHYILNRTLLRPRDFLNFTRKCIQVAASRSQDRVREVDIIAAEREYSEDMFNELKYELRDIYPQYAEVLPRFIGSMHSVSSEDLLLLTIESGIPEEEGKTVIDALLWFSFLGVSNGTETVFAYNVGYNLERMKAVIGMAGQRDKCYVVHPAFRSALLISS